MTTGTGNIATSKKHQGCAKVHGGVKGYDLATLSSSKLHFLYQIVETHVGMKGHSRTTLL